MRRNVSRETLLLGLLTLVLASCSPGNACERYGFKPGTVAFSQCVQAEWLAFQDRAFGAVIVLQVRIHFMRRRLTRLEYEMTDMRRVWRLGR